MTGEWEEKLKKIERSQLDPDIFMAGISDYIRTLIEHSSTRRLDPARWGSCPICGKEVIKGKRAYGCSGWAEGCPFVLEAECRGVTLAPRQIQALLQLRVLPQPIRIENEPRIFILSTQGLIMDLRLPSADRQKHIVKKDRPARSPVGKKQ
jgi:DNA topoisomerase-3